MAERGLLGSSLPLLQLAFVFPSSVPFASCKGQIEQRGKIRLEGVKAGRRWAVIVCSLQGKRNLSFSHVLGGEFSISGVEYRENVKPNCKGWMSSPAFFPPPSSWMKWVRDGGSADLLPGKKRRKLNFPEQFLVQFRGKRSVDASFSFSPAEGKGP